MRSVVGAASFVIRALPSAIEGLDGTCMATPVLLQGPNALGLMWIAPKLSEVIEVSNSFNGKQKQKTYFSCKNVGVHIFARAVPFDRILYHGDGMH